MELLLGIFTLIGSAICFPLIACGPWIVAILLLYKIIAWFFTPTVFDATKNYPDYDEPYESPDERDYRIEREREQQERTEEIKRWMDE